MHLFIEQINVFVVVDYECRIAKMFCRGQKYRRRNRKKIKFLLLIYRCLMRVKVIFQIICCVLLSKNDKERETFNGVHNVSYNPKCSCRENNKSYIRGGNLFSLVASPNYVINCVYRIFFGCTVVNLCFNRGF